MLISIGYFVAMYMICAVVVYQFMFAVENWRNTGINY